MTRFLRALSGAALLLGAAGQARATPVILAACAEDVSCIFQGGSISIITTAGHFNSGSARFAMRPPTPSISVPPGNRIQTNVFSSASADFWASFYYFANVGSTLTNGVFVEFLGTDGSGLNNKERLLLRGTGTTQQIKASTRNTAGTITDLATASGSTCAGSALCKLDIHVVYAVAGSIDVYNNGVNILTYSGDITTNSGATLNQMDVASFQGASSVADFSELVVSDTDTRSMKMVTCAPSAAGTSPGTWTGSASDINANSANDAIFIYTTTNNDQAQWKSGCAVPTTAGTTIVDVRQYGRLAIGATGPQNMRFSVNIGGTDYDNGSDLAGLATSFGNVKYDWGVNSPAGGIWTPADLNTIFGAGGFGVKSRP